MHAQYRQNATVIITDGAGKVLLCERTFPDVSGVTLQTVQGGIDADESPREAAERELMEELGVEREDFSIMDELNETHCYRWPDAYLEKHGLPRADDPYIGQEQHFFLAVLNPDAPMDLDAHHREFVGVRWGTARELIDGSWEAKRPGIEMALRAFGMI